MVTMHGSGVKRLTTIFIAALTLTACGGDDESACEKRMAEIAEEQRELIAENGADAPVLDFNFPDECLGFDIDVEPVGESG